MIPKKAVIVEDDSAILFMYKLKLESSGLDVQTAVNGLEGLKIIKSFSPDIVLLDLKMPLMSGDTMLERMRQTEWGSSIRVIVLTNISKDEAPSMLRLLNVDRYLVKAHHTPSQVLEVVNDVLS